ncbi:MAG TPA: carbohydrate-binding family 9-like protein, partial [Vicinamibacteria bacterium]|nr:carbohydrate-binding family 9-like protein [Vicinamibacteria bacterium]
MNEVEHIVRAARPRLEDGWDDLAWAAAEPLEIAHFRPEGSDHRPRTRARLAWEEEGLRGLFRVEDHHVRSVHTRFGDPVYQDSCVEVFLQPTPGRGYLNFEMNA